MPNNRILLLLRPHRLGGRSMWTNQKRCYGSSSIRQSWPSRTSDYWGRIPRPRKLWTLSGRPNIVGGGIDIAKVRYNSWLWSSILFRDWSLLCFTLFCFDFAWDRFSAILRISFERIDSRRFLYCIGFPLFLLGWGVLLCFIVFWTRFGFLSAFLALLSQCRSIGFCFGYFSSLTYCGLFGIGFFRREVMGLFGLIPNNWSLLIIR